MLEGKQIIELYSHLLCTRLRHNVLSAQRSDIRWVIYDWVELGLYYLYDIIYIYMDSIIPICLKQIPLQNHLLTDCWAKVFVKPIALYVCILMCFYWLMLQ